MATLHGTMSFMRKAWDFQDPSSWGGMWAYEARFREEREERQEKRSKEMAPFLTRSETNRVPMARDLVGFR